MGNIRKRKARQAMRRFALPEDVDAIVLGPHIPGRMTETGEMVPRALTCREIKGPVSVVPGLRELSDRIEGGHYGRVETALVILDADRSLNVIVRGTHPSLTYTIGMLERAKQMEIDYGRGEIEESD